MFSTRKVRTLAAATVVAAAIAGAGAAWAGDITTTQPPAPAPGSVNPAPKIAATHLSDDAFVPITPCRIIDTRTAAAGRLTVGAPRTFDISGSGATFAPQGGKAGGCAIPEGATAIEATVTAAEAGSGFLRAWPGNEAPPNATFMNYTAAFNVSNTGTIVIDGCTAVCLPNNDLRLRAYGSPTDVVVDVTGYYEHQLTAAVAGTGDLTGGTRVVSTTRLGTGTYEVIFDRNLVGCSFQATPKNGFGSAQADIRFNNNHGAFVSTTDGGGNGADRSFNLLVAC